MNPHEPPQLAVATLEWVLSDNDPLAGDLLEAARTRSRVWLWWQILMVVVSHAFAELRQRTRITTEAVLVSTAMLALLGFHAVVGASLMNHMRLMYNADSIIATTHASPHHGWQGTGAIVAALFAIAVGRMIGRIHRQHRIAAAVVFSASAVGAAFLNLFLFVPLTVLEPVWIPPDAALQIVASMLFIAGLFIGIATSPAQIRSGTTATVVVIFAAALQPAIQAQSVRERSFDVASIKRNVSNTVLGSGLAAPQPGGRYVGVGVTLRRLIGDAYDMDIEGGSDWMASDRFDVNATADGNPTATQIRLMLRLLLADRFKLKVHTESREMPVYEMRLARDDGRLGSGMKQSDAKCAEEARNFFPGTAGFPPPCGDFRLGGGAFVARGLTLTGLAQLLGGITGRPVFNRTGRDEAFDIEMKWSSDGGLTGIPRDAAGANTLSADGVTVFTALREQLGLRLDSSRAAVDVLVIDHAEPPTAD
jgi:uncharacterized protein (TIGR03435 family)